MTAYVVKGWCPVCQTRTVQNRVAVDDREGHQQLAFTVCGECDEQVGRVRAPGAAEDR